MRGTVYSNSLALGTDSVFPLSASFICSKAGSVRVIIRQLNEVSDRPLSDARQPSGNIRQCFDSRSADLQL